MRSFFCLLFSILALPCAAQEIHLFASNEGDVTYVRVAPLVDRKNAWWSDCPTVDVPRDWDYDAETSASFNSLYDGRDSIFFRAVAPDGSGFSAWYIFQSAWYVAKSSQTNAARNLAERARQDWVRMGAVMIGGGIETERINGHMTHSFGAVNLDANKATMAYIQEHGRCVLTVNTFAPQATPRPVYLRFLLTIMSRHVHSPRIGTGA